MRREHHLDSIRRRDFQGHGLKSFLAVQGCLHHLRNLVNDRKRLSKPFCQSDGPVRVDGTVNKRPTFEIS